MKLGKIIGVKDSKLSLIKFSMKGFVEFQVIIILNNYIKNQHI